MSFFDISGATFDENLRKLETSDPVEQKLKEGQEKEKE